MATRMQQRRGTASQWSFSNPILNVGEIGYESDTNKFKIGDGTNHWDDLTYFVDGAEVANIIDGAPALLDTLNELAAAIGDDPAFFTTVATNLSNHQSDSTNIHGIADTAELATKAFSASLLTGATKSNITITGDKNGLTITAENGVADSTTDNLTEGSTNKYFTDERAQDAVATAIAAGTHSNITITYDDAANKFSFAAENGVADSTTDNLTEGSTNKYFTDERAQDAVGNILGTGLSYNDATPGIGIDNAALSNYLLEGASGASYGLIGTSTYLDVKNTNGYNKEIELDIAAVESKLETDGFAKLDDTTFTGTTTVDDLSIGGTLTFSGTATEISSTNTVIEDPLLYLADGNPGNINDLGFVANYNDGTYAHTGLVRDASAGAWKLFKGVTDEPTNTVNFGQGSLDDLQVGGLTASSITVGDVSNTEFGYLNGVTSAIQTQIDAKAPKADPTFTGTVSGITKSMVGLGNVENTALSTWVGTSNITTLGTVATGTWSATEIAVTKGGTGATNASAARTNLGLAIGTDVQAYNATLAAVAGGTYTGTSSITTLGTIATGTWSGTTIALNKGGTGATTQAGAANAVLPAQTSASGKYLTSDGTDVSWATVSSYSAPTLGSTSVASGATVTTIAGLTLSGATLTGSLTASSSAGTSGQVLSSTGSGVQWITPTAGADEMLVLMGAY